MSKAPSKAKIKAYTRKRSWLRHPADPNALVWLKVISASGSTVADALVGLSIDESASGCSVVMRAHEQLKPGLTCIVTIGNREPMVASIVWIRELEPAVVRLGLSYASPGQARTR